MFVGGMLAGGWLAAYTAATAFDVLPATLTVSWPMSAAVMQRNLCCITLSQLCLAKRCKCQALRQPKSDRVTNPGAGMHLPGAYGVHPGASPVPAALAHTQVHGLGQEGVVEHCKALHHDATSSR